MAGTLRVPYSGVVLRGSGDGDDPADSTIIRATGNTPEHRDVVVVGSGATTRWAGEVAGTRTQLTSDLVACGERPKPADARRRGRTAIGALAIGDVALVAAVAAPHRAEAFAACGLLVDLAQGAHRRSGSGSTWPTARPSGSGSERLTETRDRSAPPMTTLNAPQRVAIPSFLSSCGRRGTAGALSRPANGGSTSTVAPMRGGAGSRDTTRSTRNEPER